jgi:hypothetical protein
VLAREERRDVARRERQLPIVLVHGPQSVGTMRSLTHEPGDG